MCEIAISVIRNDEMPLLKGDKKKKKITGVEETKKFFCLCAPFPSFL